MNINYCFLPLQSQTLGDCKILVDTLLHIIQELIFPITSHQLVNLLLGESPALGVYRTLPLGNTLGF